MNTVKMLESDVKVSENLDDLSNTKAYIKTFNSFF